MKFLFDSKEFEEQYHYDGKDLGAVYEKDQTTFKVWAPTAKAVQLCTYPDGSNGTCLQEYSMEKQEQGVWCACVDGDLEGTYYTYRIDIDGTIRETQDIYGKACGVNGNRSMVVDLEKTNPDGWDGDSFDRQGQTAPAIYELHIKDFSSDPCSGITKEHRGKYLAFTEAGTTLNGEGEFATCLSYIKDLGISHIHLLPTFDFASVDESKPLENQFNWGYDPENYNVPEGGYATDASDGHVRIKEFKQMVQAIHNAGMGVVMDVVYNHTYEGDSAFQRTVPGYYYRFWEDGTWSDGSACGNDTASERYMFRKFMIESVCYWAEEYHIDGFRFDLMGLHDVTTMNEIRKALDSLPGGRDILVYGEPWSGDRTAMRSDCVPALKKNVDKLNERIAIFNDDTRDAIKGSVFKEKEAGYINGDNELGAQIPSCVLAWCDGLGGYMPKCPGQTITYVSAHDNFTLWDKLNYTLFEKPDFYKKEEEVLKLNRMAAGMVMTSLGIPFFQAGEEFGRTKNGDENSFKTESAINQLDWTRAAEYRDLIEYYKGLLTIRKHFRALTTKEREIIERFSFLDTNLQETVAFRIQGIEAEGDWWKELFVVYHNTDKKEELELPEGSWNLLCDGKNCVPEGLEACGNTIILNEKSVMILGRK
ncbi:MAG: type I pullulanase [Lachnospiraceae bacterium]|nr:type I pullulanase [Lachnospiraceae bacterium]